MCFRVSTLFLRKQIRDVREHKSCLTSIIDLLNRFLLDSYTSSSNGSLDPRGLLAEKAPTIKSARALKSQISY